MGTVDVTFTPADLHALDQKLEKMRIDGALYNMQQERMVEK